jgi:hypothetical protein
MKRLNRRAYADPVYLAARRALLATGPLCHECKVRPARVADHVPSLSEHNHALGGGCTCVLLPHCWECSSSQGGRLRARHLDEQLARISGQQQEDEIVEPVGFDADDRAWDVPWLDELRDVPDNATWPRLMTPPWLTTSRTPAGRSPPGAAAVGPDVTFVFVAEIRTTHPKREAAARAPVR